HCLQHFAPVSGLGIETQDMERSESASSDQGRKANRDVRGFEPTAGVGKNMGFLSGKRALIVGLATDRSIAWGIAQAMHREGAELAFAHIERMTDRVVPLARQLGSDITFVMDVASDEEIAQGFAQLKSRWDAFDILVHAVAFAPREALTGGFLDATTREGFRVAHDISSYSFTALARASLPFMQGRSGSMISL